MAKPENTEKLIAENRKAHFEYFIEERFEAGLVLQGWEVKAMRAGRAQLAEAYVFVRNEASVPDRRPHHAAGTDVHPQSSWTRCAPASCCSTRTRSAG